MNPNKPALSIRNDRTSARALVLSAFGASEIFPFYLTAHNSDPYAKVLKTRQPDLTRALCSNFGVTLGTPKMGHKYQIFTLDPAQTETLTTGLAKTTARELGILALQAYVEPEVIAPAYDEDEDDDSEDDYSGDDEDDYE